MKNNLVFLLFSLLAIKTQGQYSADLEVEELMSSEVNGIGQKIIYPSFENARVSMKRITFPPGTSTGWHKHEIPVFSYIIRGTLTVETENEARVRYPEGSSFSESYDTFHRGINLEEGNLVVLAIYLGGDRKPLSEPKPE